jgi:hypothetical protein
MNNRPYNFQTNHFIIAVLALGSIPAFAQVSISVNVAPPPLQVYSQPACPDDGYIWNPGYWAYGDNGYYWVPGEWVQPPQIGELWTPPYWEWNDGAYVFNAGYWGPNVGYYGGVNYGYGYGGHGYGGGRWQGGHFSYNTAVNNVSSANIHNTYVDRTAISNNTSKVSYNGGKGGLQAKPTAQERQTSNNRHAQPSSMQNPEVTKPIHSSIQQKVEPQLEPAREQQPEPGQQRPPQQPIHPQEPAQPKQEIKPSTQPAPQTHANEPAAQPDKRSDNAPSAPTH